MDYEMSIRDVLIERIRDLRKLLAENSVGSSRAFTQDLLDLNIRIYHHVFSSRI